MRIGVLAVQGSFSLHVRLFSSLGIEPVEIRRASDMTDISGIVLPGGESTAFQIILDSDNLGDYLRRELRTGLPAWGTCAGAIMFGRSAAGDPFPGWGLIDVEVVRNGYGRQVDSFVAPLRITGFEYDFNGIFIRAPIFLNPGRGVDVLAEFDGEPVMARQDNLLATSFHPELTSDTRVHEYFLQEFCAQFNLSNIKSA